MDLVSFWHRRRRWIIVVLLVVGVRALLPLAVRQLITTQASKAINARVEVANVDLWLLRGGIALDDVRVIPTASGAASPDPVVAWKRLKLGLRWWPLVHRTAHLREIEFDTPTVNVERLESGAINLAALASAASPDAAPAEPSVPWGLVIDRFALRSGTLRFQDRMVAGSEPIILSLNKIDVGGLALRPGSYREPSQLHVDLNFDDAIVAVDAKLAVEPPYFLVEADINAERLPLHRTRLYIPNVGWSELTGEVTAALHYEFEAGLRHALRGHISVDDLTVQVAELDQPALHWRHLGVQIDPLDLVGNRIALPDVQLDGLLLPIRATGSEPLPILSALAKPDTAPPDPGAAAPPPQPPTGPPWQWSVGTVAITDGRALVLGASSTLDVGIRVDARNLADPSSEPAQVRVRLAPGTGTLDLAGALQLKPLGFNGTLAIAQLDLLPPLLVSGAVPADILRAGQLTTDLTLAVGSTATPPGAAQVKGSISLATPHVVTAQGSFAAHAVELMLDDLQVTDILPADPAAPPPDVRRVQLRGGVLLTQPQVAATDPAQRRLAAQSIALTLDDLDLGARSAGSPIDSLAARARLIAADMRLDEQGATPALSIGGLDLSVDHATVTGEPAGAAAARMLDVSVRGVLSLTDLELPSRDGRQPAVSTRALTVTLDEVTLPKLLGAAEAAAHASTLPGGAHVRGTIALADPRVTTAAPNGGFASVGTITVSLDEVLVSGDAPDRAGEHPGDIRARGRVSLTEPRAATADARDFLVAAKALDLGIDEVVLPQLLAQPTGDAPAADPMVVHLDALRIVAPSVRVTRTAAGLVLPAFGPESDAAAPPAPPPTPAPGATPRAPTDLLLRALTISDGQVVFNDRAVKPAFAGGLNRLTVDVQNVRFPQGSIGQMQVAATLVPQGALDVSGSLAPGKGSVKLELKRIPLLPFNPYATAYSPFGVAGGSLSLKTKASMDRDRYDASNSITLHDFDVSGAGGDSLVKEQLGLPLPMLLALLRDPTGKISLDVPIATDAAGTSVGIGTLLAGALRQALVGALASPLKLAGAVFQNGKVQAIAPPHIPFGAGRDEIPSESETLLSQLAAFVGSRPGLGVTLHTDATERDRRWLAEQGLRAALGEPQGVFGRIRNLTQGGRRDRIAAALDARARDDVGELAAEDAAVLEQWLAERPPVEPARLQALGQSRLEHIRDLLVSRHAVAASQITLQPVPADLAETDPSVRIDLGATVAAAEEP